jgi:hypothetical protein
MSQLELQQRASITFLVKLGKSGNEIREKLVQVYGDNTMKITAVYKWVHSVGAGVPIFVISDSEMIALA